MIPNDVNPALHAFTAEQNVLLERLQFDAFHYFMAHAAPATGLIADSSHAGAAASIAATGFALSCYPVAVERGWLTRARGLQITLATLRFFHDSPQGKGEQETGYQGFYYHFLDMHTGRRAHGCELSTIDTAILLGGMLVAARYFDNGSAAEEHVRSLTGTLVERANWAWTMDDNGGVNQAWMPADGFHKSDWDGYTEALLLYTLGAASTAHPIPKATYERDARRYRWHHNAGVDWIHAAPLFIHLFPQAWLDLRGLQDGFVNRHADIDYFENSRRAIHVQRNYARLNPFNFVGYGRGIWGLSACQGPSGALPMRDGERRQFLGYSARGVTAGPDDGTLVPWAATTCMAHTPDLALEGLRAMLTTYPRALRDGRFVGAINPSLPGDGPEGWISPGCFGIDQGLVVMMIENARSGLLWKLTRKSPVIRKGLRALGFTGGWLDPSGEA